MNYPELIAWLLSQIDDDLMWAREASRRGDGEALVSGVHWQWVSTGDGRPATPRPNATEHVGDPHFHQVDMCSTEHWPHPDRPPHDASGFPQFAIPMAREIPSAVGGHIVRHDPARVIRDLTARRRSVLRCFENLGLRLADGLLRDMASAYAERPGYRPEWGPEDN